MLHCRDHRDLVTSVGVVAVIVRGKWSIFFCTAIAKHHRIILSEYLSLCFVGLSKVKLNVMKIISITVWQ